MTAKIVNHPNCRDRARAANFKRASEAPFLLPEETAARFLGVSPAELIEMSKREDGPRRIAMSGGRFGYWDNELRPFLPPIEAE